MLLVENLSAWYGGNQALKSISMEVAEGEIVCLIGANGAGKSTLLNCLSAVHPQRSGTIRFREEDVSRVGSQKLVAMGLVQVPEGRQLFGPLTVEENLEMGAYLRAGRMTGSELSQEIDRVMEIFPKLRSLRTKRAATLSGGEQQMVSIGRGLMANPKLLLLDEPSLGLAPLVAKDIFRIIVTLQQEGKTILLVEQNAVAALKISDRAYVIENGRITGSGPAAAVMDDPTVRRAFLGQEVAVGI